MRNEPTQKPITLVSALILIDGQNKILLAERPSGKSMAGLWEFPGGKVEEGETPETALCREIKEELNIMIKEVDLNPLTFASHTYEMFHLLMPLFICRIWEGNLHSNEKQKFNWVEIKDLRSYPMPPADEPLVEFIEKHF
jgi:8-oxo-dGTP diphosphatase